MAKSFCYSNWCLITLLIFITSCASNRSSLKNLVEHGKFFAKDKSVVNYNEKIQKDYRSKKVISPQFYKCLNGDIDSAIDEIYKMAWKNNTVDLRLDLANCYFVNKDYSSALVIYGQVLAMTNSEMIHSLVYNNLGLAYANKGFYQQAETFFKKASRLNSNNQISRFNSSVIKAKIGKFSKSLSSLNRLARSNNDPFIDHTQLLILAIYDQSKIKDKEIPINNEKINDRTLFVGILNSRDKNNSQRLKILDDVDNSKLTIIGNDILDNLILKSEEQVKHEKDRSDIYNSQQARSLGNKK